MQRHCNYQVRQFQELVIFRLLPYQIERQLQCWKLQSKVMKSRKQWLCLALVLHINFSYLKNLNVPIQTYTNKFNNEKKQQNYICQQTSHAQLKSVLAETQMETKRSNRITDRSQFCREQESSEETEIWHTQRTSSRLVNCEETLKFPNGFWTWRR